jgi:putative inorganic carbon (hco3(-)) transporter
MKRELAVKWFDSVQVIVLMAVSPLFIFPKPRFWWIFLIIPLLAIIRKFVAGHFWERTMADVPVFLFLAAVLASTRQTPDLPHSLPKIAGILFALAFFYALIALLKSEKLSKWAVNLFLLGGFGFSLIGLLGMPTFTEKHLGLLEKIKDHIPRLDFNLPGAEPGFAPTVVGGILLLVIPLFLVTLIYSYGQRNQSIAHKLSILLLAAGLLVSTAVLLLTQARGAWTGLFFSTTIILLLLLMKSLKKKKMIAAAIITLLVLGILAGAGAYAMAHSNQLRPGLKQAEGTLLFRVQLWNLTLPLIRRHPLLGIGLNQFRTLPEVRYFLSHAHNQFLHVAVEIGIPALIAFMAILLALGYMAVQVWKTSPSRWMRYTVLGLGWGQLAHLFFCLTDAIPPGAKVGILFWISLALITALYQLSLRQTNKAQE